MQTITRSAEITSRIGLPTPYPLAFSPDDEEGKRPGEKRPGDEGRTNTAGRLVRRIERESGVFAPALIVPRDTDGIDDGGGYGDPVVDRRPEFVREDDRKPHEHTQQL
ncbi:MAG: hypothetical protein HY866_20785 [Chloroflexi bacterium]|nr:hypothetical protein [Chloroflexota bacterium]